jgi:hypothetical protein
MNLPKTQMLLPENIENSKEMQSLLLEYMEHCKFLRLHPDTNMIVWNKKSIQLEQKINAFFPIVERNVNPYIKKKG